MVNTEKVTAIVGAFCSGADHCRRQHRRHSRQRRADLPVGHRAGRSPPSTTTTSCSATSFRTPSRASRSPSCCSSKGIKNVGVTYVNNDYGKGLADAFAAAYTADGGTVAANVAHEDGKADYRAELGQLEAARHRYPRDPRLRQNAGGGTILQQAVESGNFKHLRRRRRHGRRRPAHQRDRQGPRRHDPDHARLAPPARPTTRFAALAKASGVDPTSTYVPNSYDAVFLLALAIEKNGTADRDGLAKALRDVATAPGEVILPGEWKKAVDLIKAGKDINYEGASGDDRVRRQRRRRRR